MQTPVFDDGTVMKLYTCRSSGQKQTRLSQIQIRVIEHSHVLSDGVHRLEDEVLCLCSAFVDSRVETAIVKVATDVDAATSQTGQEHKAVSKVKQKARAFLQEMVANISPAFIRYILWKSDLSCFSVTD